MKRMLVLMKNGHEEVEALAVVDMLRRAGVEVFIVGLEDSDEVVTSHGVTLKADCRFEDRPREYDAIYVPGGVAGAEAVAADERVTAFIRETYESGKLVFAMCAGPIALEAAGILPGHCITCYPGFEARTPSAGSHGTRLVEKDGNIITSRGPATALFLALAAVEALAGEEAREDLEKKILLPIVVEQLR